MNISHWFEVGFDTHTLSGFSCLSTSDLSGTNMDVQCNTLTSTTFVRLFFFISGCKTIGEKKRKNCLLFWFAYAAFLPELWNCDICALRCDSYFIGFISHAINVNIIFQKSNKIDVESENDWRLFEVKVWF